MIDITRYLDINTAVWPGDTPFESTPVCEIGSGDIVNLNTIKTSLHNGTHVDAPWHYSEAGERIDALALPPFVGPCVVVGALSARPIRPDVLEGVGVESGDRILFRTAEQPAAAWVDSNAHLSVETVIALSKFQCKLVGIDSSSVDDSKSKSLSVHKALGRHRIHILENLDLTRVESGRYILIALPLKLRGLDASPVRAVLLTEEEWIGVSQPQSSSRM